MQIESRHRWCSEGEGSVTSSDITANTGYKRKRLHAFYLVCGTRCLDFSPSVNGQSSPLSQGGRWLGQGTGRRGPAGAEVKCTWFLISAQLRRISCLVQMRLWYGLQIKPSDYWWQSGRLHRVRFNPLVFLTQALYESKQLVSNGKKEIVFS